MNKEHLDRFKLTDMVTWDRDIYPSLVAGMIEQYGEGPFQVVGLRLHHPKAMAAFPVAVMIEVEADSRKEFAGEWFKKV